MADDEQELTGGNASESVVRIGNTVRTPWLEKWAVVQSYLGALRAAGVDVPEPLGRDIDGRYVIEYVEGVSALDQLPLGHAEPLRVGGMIRQIHDASEAVVIPAVLFDGQPVDEAALSSRAFVDGYGADVALRKALPAAMGERTAAMDKLLKSSHETGFQPWADMYVNGHGEHWRAAAEYVLRNQTSWERALV